jgi:hypothetical protein
MKSALTENVIVEVREIKIEKMHRCAPDKADPGNGSDYCKVAAPVKFPELRNRHGLSWRRWNLPGVRFGSGRFAGGDAAEAAVG